MNTEDRVWSKIELSCTKKTTVKNYTSRLKTVGYTPETKNCILQESNQISPRVSQNKYAIVFVKCLYHRTEKKKADKVT